MTIVELDGHEGTNDGSCEETSITFIYYILTYSGDEMYHYR